MKFLKNALTPEIVNNINNNYNTTFNRCDTQDKNKYEHFNIFSDSELYSDTLEAKENIYLDFRIRLQIDTIYYYQMYSHIQFFSDFIKYLRNLEINELVNFVNIFLRFS